MMIAKLKIDGCNGPCVFRTTGALIEELSDLLAGDFAYNSADTMHITLAEMTQEELDALPEFEGW